MPASDDWLDDLAGAVLDGTPVDWTAAETRAGSAARPLIRHLRLVAFVARIHGDVQATATVTASPIADREDNILDCWGHLRLLERVGRGACGEVFRAWDTRLDREVALKLLPAPSSDRHAPNSIIREGRLLAKVRHPNVVTIHGAEQIGDRIGLWMEFVRGHTLEQTLQEGNVFRPEDVIAIGVELCRAVSAVHAAGLLHRDIKAHNVMRAEDGRIVLMDFGAGRELNDGSPPDVAGTPMYLAPELFRSEPATVQSDVYGLGVLLFRLVTGKYPVHGHSVRELGAAHERGARVGVREVQPGIRPRLARLIDQAIDPQPERRPQTAATLGDSLVQLRRRPQTTPLLYATGLVSFLIIAGLITWAWRTYRANPIAPLSTVGVSTVSSVPALSPTSSTPPPADGAAAGDTPGRVSQSIAVPSKRRPDGVRPSVQVLPLTNASGRISEAWLSAALAEMILREFRGSESFRWIPGAPALAKAQLGEAFGTLGSGSIGRLLVIDRAQTIRPIVPADIIVSGEYTALAQRDGLRLILKVEDTTSGHAATLSETGATTDLVGLVSRIGAGARVALGVATLTASQASALRVSQPANANAARAYAEGLARGASEAVPFMEQAVAADPRFAPAYIALAEGLYQSSSKDAEKVQAAATRALSLSVDFPREERLLIEIRALAVSWTSATLSSSIEARDAIHAQLFSLFPDTLAYGYEKVRALNRVKRYQEALDTVDTVARLPGASEHVELLRLEAELARLTRNYPRAQRALDQTTGIARTLGDRTLLGSSRYNAAVLAREVGEPARALALAEEAAQHFAASGDRSQVFMARAAIGEIARSQDSFAWVKPAYSQMIAQARDQGNHTSESALRNSLASLLVEHGDLSDARTTWEQMAQDLPVDELASGAHIGIGLGVVLFRQGDLPGARQKLQTALASAVSRQDRYQEGVALYFMAQLLLEQGEVTLAHEHADLSLQAARETSFPRRDQLASALTVLGRTLLARGETDAVRQTLEEAIVITGRNITTVDHSHFDVASTRALIALGEQAVESKWFANNATELAHKQFWPDDEAAAASLLALAWLGEGNLDEAQKSAARAAERIQITQDRLLRLSGGIAAARVRAASNAPASVALARRQLDTLSREAAGLGAVATSFEARLALGEIEISTGDVSTGRARLAALERDAVAKGFVSFAKKAAAAAKSP